MLALIVIVVSLRKLISKEKSKFIEFNAKEVIILGGGICTEERQRQSFWATKWYKRYKMFCVPC